MKAILGKKLGMTQVFREDGTVVPVTRVQAGPCVVTQVKTKERDGVDSIQIGFGKQKIFRVGKPQQGHLKDIKQDGDGMTVRVLRDTRIGAHDHNLKRGDVFTVKIFKEGEKVQVCGESKGKGFQGVVKRHGFSGSLASHGHKDQLRMPGSIGATDPGRVFKGIRMAGHMGAQKVTVKNLEVVRIKPEENELLIKGAVPGARNSLIIVSTSEGSIEVEEIKKDAVKPVAEASVSAVEESMPEPAETSGEAEPEKESGE